MYFRLVALLLVSSMLGSCAYQGVVVEKTARELPFSETVGMPGSFAFMLRDSAGVVHRQLVTPEVFMAYEVGDSFNDQQPTPPRQRVSDGKEMLTAANVRRTSAARVAKTPTAKHATHVASKTNRKHRHAVAGVKRTRAHKSKAAAAKRHPKKQPTVAAAVAAAAPSRNADAAAVVRIARVR